jgi:hypothetical protein
VIAESLTNRWVFVLSLLVTGLVVLAGCGSGSDDEALSTLGELSGVWQRSAVHTAYGNVYVAFNEDGSYRLATGSAERIKTHSLTEGEIWFEKGQLHIRDTSGSPSGPACLGPEQVGIYEVQRHEDGKIEFVSVDDPCGGGGRSSILMTTYEPVADQGGSWISTWSEICSESGTGESRPSAATSWPLCVLQAVFLQ